MPYHDQGKTTFLTGDLEARSVTFFFMLQVDSDAIY